MDKLPNWVIQGDRGTIYVKEKSVDIYQVKIPDKLDPAGYGNQPEIKALHEELNGEHRITMNNRYGDPDVIYPEIAKAIKGRAAYPVSAASALALTRILDAVRLSSSSNQIVSI